jgi:hypothetical protein
LLLAICSELSCSSFCFGYAEAEERKGSWFEDDFERCYFFGFASTLLLVSDLNDAVNFLLPGILLNCSVLHLQKLRKGKEGLEVITCLCFAKLLDLPRFCVSFQWFYSVNGPYLSMFCSFASCFSSRRAHFQKGHGLATKMH